MFGLGYVGCVSLGCLAQNGHEVVGVDTNNTKVDQINSGKATIIEKEIDDIIREQKGLGRISATTDFVGAVMGTELSMIAVGTPSTPNGHLDLSYIEKVCQEIGEAIKLKDSSHTVLLRSTVPPGTNERVGDIIGSVSGKRANVDFFVVSNPEFLREGTAVFDYYHPPFTVVGAGSQQAVEIVRRLYEKVPGEFIVTAPGVAEMIKYVSNSFHALKVTFANEVANVCQSLGVDPYDVMEIFVKDKSLNISPYYLKPGFAYGGSCLPKDLAGLKAFAHDNYVDAPVLDSISRSNEAQVRKAVDLIVSTNKKAVTFLGLSFKSGTDDLRNSPAVTVIETLVGKGFRVVVYDRNISLTKLTGTNWHYIRQHLPHLSALLVHDISEAVNASDVIVVASGGSELKQANLNLDGKLLIDLTGGAREFAIRPGYLGLSWH